MNRNVFYFSLINLFMLSEDGTTNTRFVTLAIYVVRKLALWVRPGTLCHLLSYKQNLRPDTYANPGGQGNSAITQRRICTVKTRKGYTNVINMINNKSATINTAHCLFWGQLVPDMCSQGCKQINCTRSFGEVRKNSLGNARRMWQFRGIQSVTVSIFSVC